MPSTLLGGDVGERATQKIIAGRTTMILDLPFWGSLSMRLRLRVDPACPTAWVDGRTFGYNPAFVESLTTSEVVALVAHEVMHCAMGHPWRRGSRDPGRWNEACDRVINPILRDAGFKLPDGALFELDASHLGKSAEWVYDRLPEPDEQDDDDEGDERDDEGEQSEAAPDGNGADAGDDEPGEEEENDDDDGGGAGAGDADGDAGAGDDDGARGDGDGDAQKPQPAYGGDLGELRDAPDDDAGDDDTTEADWKQAVQQAEVLAQSQGKLPGGAQRAASDALRVDIDWRSATMHWMQERARNDYSLSRPNRRFLHTGVILPSLYSTEVGDLVYALDTSASIDDVAIGQMEHQMNAVADAVRPRRIIVIYCDAAVRGVTIFEQGDPIVLEPLGGGGTDFRPVFEYVAQMDEQPVGVIYHTDLWGTFPSEVPDVDVLWAATTDRPVPFGDVVRIR